MFVNRLTQGFRYFEISSTLYFLFILILINKSNAQDNECDFGISLTTILSTESIRNTNYPNKNSGAEHCTWHVATDANARVNMTCNEFDVPSSLLCATQSLDVYTNPGAPIANLIPQIYCGTGSFSLMSVNSSLDIIYRSTLLGKPARFYCTVSVFVPNQ
ncbi:zinc metalloproteinase nas-39-like [Leptopilina boulardi]|uniref:zinc metalloproteinase nas-39-like n=1 Tax=Leptopilina boulardi TaxID=63433 RepID=UPI0021F56358|nr:zinc metalloproteinase nas-39-like [Leptopilina boulardi]